MKPTNTTISIIGYNAILNEALADLFPIESSICLCLLTSDNSILKNQIEQIEHSKLVFVELSDVIDTSLNIIPQLLRINPDLKIIGLNEYTQKSYSNRIIELGAKGYIPIHSFTAEFQNAIEKVQNGNIFESKFIQKFVA